MLCSIPSLSHSVAALRTGHVLGHEKCSQRPNKRAKKRSKQDPIQPATRATIHDKHANDTGHAANPASEELSPQHAVMSRKNGNVGVRAHVAEQCRYPRNISIYQVGFVDDLVFGLAGFNQHTSPDLTAP